MSGQVRSGKIATNLMKLIVDDLVQRLRDVGGIVTFNRPDALDQYTFSVERNSKTFHVFVLSGGSIAIWDRPWWNMDAGDRDHFRISDPGPLWSRMWWTLKKKFFLT